MPGKTVLIDSGLGTNLLNNLAKLKINPKQNDAVLITHMHGDHIGGLVKNGKAVFPNADIYISKNEHQYWTSEKEMKKAGIEKRGNFELAAAVVKIYGEKLRLFVPNELEKIKESLLEGISPIAAYGHTPGHAVYLIESNGEKLLVWGDLTHAMSVQMPVPDVAIRYDIDPKLAVEAREKILKYVAKNKIPVAGMHIAPPGAGRVEAAGKGYLFTPFK
jgi:glyoxylase-like metal-dependent hydrolase (beta-lactamase superfamily II)